MDVTTLGELLEDPAGYAGDGDRYVSLPVDEEWVAETPARVLDEEELDHGLQGEEFQGPRAAASLDVYADVVGQLLRQKDDPTPEERLDAFVYYWDNGTYLALSG